jgi:tripartite-type tricarboxylate transporter receptor subunit TctC
LPELEHEKIEMPEARKELRPLAVTTATRVGSLPDVPTVSETVSGYEANGWSGVAVRKGTSSEVIERLNREINAGLVRGCVEAGALRNRRAPRDSNFFMV